jgi:hypothetical protein
MNCPGKNTRKAKTREGITELRVARPGSRSVLIMAEM